MLRTRERTCFANPENYGRATSILLQHTPMLSISLSKNEAIVVGAGIVVTVLEVCGDEVRLCIERSEDVSPEQAEVCAAVAETAEEPAISSW